MEHGMSAPTSAAVCLRAEQPGDAGTIRQINEAAFKGTAEADLIDALRAAGGITLSAVAIFGGRQLGGGTADPSRRTQMCTGEVIGGELVGHVLFTRVVVATQKGEAELLGLGPVAVLPAKQHQGIGTMMISGSLEHLRALHHRGVVVVGGPGYYRRFGFIQADRWGLQWETEVPKDNFMALELTPGALTGISGVVRYRPEFAQA
jgi:putative acetyltransferase